ncbi:MAG: cell envelope integrity protein TolA, partial [Betaproteobacteria bacterium]|nr:cell envelope integrity protein TolA [Betaproteobacteria bacterium]
MSIQTHEPPSAAPDGSQYSRPNRLFIAMAVSLLLHAILFFGVTFQFPQPKPDKITSSLEVVLVNTKTPAKP